MISGNDTGRFEGEGREMVSRERTDKRRGSCLLAHWYHVSLQRIRAHSIFFTLTESDGSYPVALFRLIQSLLSRETLKNIHWAIVRVIQAIQQIKSPRFAPPWTLIGKGRSRWLRHSFVMWYEMNQWLLRKYTGGSVVLTQPPISRSWKGPEGGPWLGPCCSVFQIVSITWNKLNVHCSVEAISWFIQPKKIPVLIYLKAVGNMFVCLFFVYLFIYFSNLYYAPSLDSTVTAKINLRE